MEDQAATLRGILERNEAAALRGESAVYHLNHVTVELDTSEADDFTYESLEGQPVSTEGHFEVREHPESGTRWVFKVQALRADTPGGEGPPLSAPPPPA